MTWNASTIKRKLYGTGFNMSKLKTIREEAKLSQSALSNLSGVSLRMIQKYETRDRDINNAKAITVHKLALALNVYVEDILEEVRDDRT